jgi:hypothetical protein
MRNALTIPFLFFLFFPRICTAQSPDIAAPATLAPASLFGDFVSRGEVETIFPTITASGTRGTLRETEGFTMLPFSGGECDSSTRKETPLPFAGYNPRRTSVQWDHAAIMGGAAAVTVTAIHIYQRNAWWKDQRTSFHFVNDNTYALNVDKAGHFYGGAISAWIGQKSLEWCGFSRDASVITGSILGALFELYVEFEDGFAKNWGFSPGDAYGDLIGAAWPLGQHYIPYMEHFQPKFSYFPSREMRNGTHAGNMIDDYNGQTTWMGIHVHGLLPCSWRRYWPSWLALAVGVAARGIDIPGAEKERIIILSLDYDMTKILPGDSWFMTTLKQGLNYIHFPAPAIRISPNYIAYGLYF